MSTVDLIDSAEIELGEPDDRVTDLFVNGRVEEKTARQSDAGHKRAGTKPGAASSADPTRLYLGSMSRTELLTREGEVEICVRIEKGEESLLTAVSTSRTAINHLVTLGEELRRGKQSVADFVCGGDQSHEHDASRTKEVLAKVDRIGRVNERCTKLSASLAARGIASAERKRLTRSLERNEASVQTLLHPTLTVAFGRIRDSKGRSRPWNGAQRHPCTLVFRPRAQSALEAESLEFSAGFLPSGLAR